MAEKLNLKELRDKPKAELLTKLAELKQELSQLRVAQVTGGAPSRLAKIRVVRKQIAQILTAYNANLKDDVRQALKGKKLSLDLRHKQTRALRRRLSPAQAAAMTLRQRKKAAHHPIKKFAIKN